MSSCAAVDLTQDNDDGDGNDEWLLVAETTVSNLQERHRTWLQENVTDGQLSVQIFTGVHRKGLRERRNQLAEVRCATTPELQATSRRGRWTPLLGDASRADSCNFQRVRVLQTERWQWTALGLQSLPYARLLAELNPSLMLEHMASELGFHAHNLKLRCCVLPQPRQSAEPQDSANFSLRTCSSGAAAEQPPRFQRFPLRPEQLRSLRWMLDREARPAEFGARLVRRFAPGVRWECQPQHHEFSSFCPADLYEGYAARTGYSWAYEAALDATFRASAGVLGDKIGCGKTATLIGLLDTQRSQPAPACPPEAAHFVPINSTLILVPSNLLGQWQGEIHKFLGPDAFRMIVIENITKLKALTVRDFMQCELVLTTYRVLYSADYSERLKTLQCTRENRLHERYFLGRPIRQTLQEVERAQLAVAEKGVRSVGWTMRVKTIHDWFCGAECNKDQLLLPSQVKTRIKLLGACEDLQELRHPVFELFYWRRIVLDEFHELEAMGGRHFEMLKNLRAHCRWGLTGTPPKRDRAQIAVLAELLRMYVDGSDAAHCQLFLDTFVRQSGSSLPEIPVREHLVVVEQTAAERALYLQHEFDWPRRNLLQLCSHYRLQPDGCDYQPGASARDSAEQLREEKVAKLEDQRALAVREYEVLAALSGGCKGTNKIEAEAAARLAKAEADARAAGLGGFLERQPARDGSRSDLARSAHASGPGACETVLKALASGKTPRVTLLRAARAQQLGRCSAAVERLAVLARSLRYFEATLRVLLNSDAQECPVCLEDMTPDSAVLLPCSHAFHLACACKLEPQLCPSCRAPFQRRSLGALRGGASSTEAQRFGSKLAKVGETLSTILQDEPDAKAIIFVQWQELEKLVGEALTDMGIPHLRLCGMTTQRSRSIATFQEEPEPRVLLQSLENSASGTNLTRANHVLLLHPMDAESRERAVAYEMQALGRVRRCGQGAACVHLWRFVTKDTVEEVISEEHQRGLVATDGHSVSGCPGASSGT